MVKKKILIIGAGSMGTAFSFPCSDNSHSVRIVGTHLEDKFIDKINLNKFHPSLLCKVPNKVKFLKYKNLSEEINKKIDLIVIAVSSKGIDWVSLELVKLLKKNIPILILTKGLALYKNKFEVLSEKMKRILSKRLSKKVNISVAGGPCLAKSLANRIHTFVIFANTNIKFVKKLANLVSTNYYHVFTSNDVLGVQVCAAIKNIFSMVIGSSVGLCKINSSEEVKKKNYLNTAAGLVQQSVVEMQTFTLRLKGKKETVLGLAGIGDLYVSATGGRNSKMGEYLGHGLSFREAKKRKMPNDTVEGADLAKDIGPKILKDFKAKSVPLMTSMIKTICYEKKLKIYWKSFNLKKHS